MSLDPYTISMTEAYGQPDSECDEHPLCRSCPKDGKSCSVEERIKELRMEEMQNEWEARRGH